MARPVMPEQSASFGIMDHNFVFWLGDLNYRIDLPLEETMARAKSGSVEDIGHLLMFDQVRTGPCVALRCFFYGYPWF